MSMSPRDSALSLDMLKLDVVSGMLGFFVAPALLFGLTRAYPSIGVSPASLGKYAPYVAVFGILGTRLVVDAAGTVVGAEATNWMEIEMVLSTLLLLVVVYFFVANRNLPHTLIYVYGLALVLFAVARATDW